MSPEALQGFVELCPDTAELVIRPGQLMDEQLMGIIDNHKTIPGQNNGKIWVPKLWNGVKSDSWLVGITDGKEDLPFDESIYWINPEAPEDQRIARTNEQMVAEYAKRYVAKGLKLMPQRGYVPSAATRMAQGKVLDRRYWSAFERPADAAYLPFAEWSDVRVNLGGVLALGTPAASCVVVLGMRVR
ncbi:hypothetical protein HZA39_03670 [Candidatus Peregrinibacteria bacterium]|nr:hypothetical protein [Candidatus Peregrinibacteria bacterium]